MTYGSGGAWPVCSWKTSSLTAPRAGSAGNASSAVAYLPPGAVTTPRFNVAPPAVFTQTRTCWPPAAPPLMAKRSAR